MKTALTCKDRQYCGNAPDWILEIVLERIQGYLDRISAATDSRNASEVAKTFALGAIRYISDSVASGDCDVLLAKMDELFKEAEGLFPSMEIM